MKEKDRYLFDVAQTIMAGTHVGGRSGIRISTDATCVWPPFSRELHKFRGGFGITHFRDPSFVEREIFPGIGKVLENVTGLAVFLGNGTSTLPIYLADRVRTRRLKYPPVLVDLYDYSDFLADIEEAESAIRRYGNGTSQLILSDLSQHKTNARVLLGHLRAGNLKFLKYCVGGGDAPAEIQNAQIVINIFGPNVRSYDE